MLTDSTNEHVHGQMLLEDLPAVFLVGLPQGYQLCLYVVLGSPNYHPAVQSVPGHVWIHEFKVNKYRKLTRWSKIKARGERSIPGRSDGMARKTCCDKKNQLCWKE